MTDHLSDDYWNQRYIEGSTGWDLGIISPPIQAYIDQLSDKNLRILIPGAGSGHEAEYLHKKGFTDVHVLDFAPEAIATFLKRNPNFPKEHTHVADFFKYSDQYDLILEQTLFCAIDPILRQNYAEHTATLLRPGGKLVGLLFNRTFEGGPPFGGDKSEYVPYFQPHFSEVNMEPCHNSITPRAGTELFIRLKK